MIQCFLVQMNVSFSFILIRHQEPQNKSIVCARNCKKSICQQKDIRCDRRSQGVLHLTLNVHGFAKIISKGWNSTSTVFEGAFGRYGIGIIYTT